jgi:hypothetical protein
MSITVRIAHEDDFPAIYEMDCATNIAHPIYVIPWKEAGPGACDTVCLDRYKHFYQSRNPEYTFLVATDGDEIIGYLVYQKPPSAGESEEWKPSFPEGTNLRFFDKVLGGAMEAKKQYNLKDHWGTYSS